MLHDRLGLTGTNYGCGQALCGACMVHLDGERVLACGLPAIAAEGRRVTTIEVSERGEHPVQKVWIDCGMVIDADGVLAQIEGAILYGLSAALTGEIRIEGGKVAQSNFHDHPVLHFDEAPAIETVIVASTAAPGGVGEIGTSPVAPAVANAIFAGPGQRVRSLPFSRHGLA